MKREKYSFIQIHKKLIKTIQNREPSKLRKISAVWMSSFWIATLNGDMASTKLMLLRRQAAADPVRGGRLTKPPTLKPPELQWNSSFLAENEPCDQFNYKKLKEGRTKLLWQWEEKTWKTCSCKQTTWLNLVGEEDLGWTLSEDSYFTLTSCKTRSPSRGNLPSKANAFLFMGYFLPMSRPFSLPTFSYEFMTQFMHLFLLIFRVILSLSQVNSRNQI